MATTHSTTAILDVLDSWLTSRLSQEAHRWWQDRCRVCATGDRKGLFLAFGLASRKVGKDDLDLSDNELAAAAAVRPGWDARNWTVDQTARMRLLLSFPAADAAAYVAVVDQVFAAGEVHELVALYQGLPLFPHPAAFTLRCAEGLRTNMQPVFLAIVHRNPFPSEQLSDDQWNQLILKSVFLGISLDPIVGLDQRANAKLAGMLVEFAEERWAAGRTVTPELWRLVGPFADESALKALERVLSTGADLERQAAVLALRSCPHEKARHFLAHSPFDTTPYTSWEQIALNLGTII